MVLGGKVFELNGFNSTLEGDQEVDMALFAFMPPTAFAFSSASDAFAFAIPAKHFVIACGYERMLHSFQRSL